MVNLVKWKFELEMYLLNLVLINDSIKSHMKVFAWGPLQIRYWQHAPQEHSEELLLLCFDSLLSLSQSLSRSRFFFM